VRAGGGALLVVVALGILWLVVTGKADGVLRALSGQQDTSAGAPDFTGGLSQVWEGLRRAAQGAGGSPSAPASSPPVNQLSPLPAYPGYNFPPAR
jgi:hypothetical protein